MGDSYAMLTNSYFSANFAPVGGVAFILWGNMSVYSSNFTLNTATYGGVFFLALSDAITLQCGFDNNRAEYGGVLRSFTSTKYTK